MVCFVSASRNSLSRHSALLGKLLQALIAAREGRAPLAVALEGLFSWPYSAAAPSTQVNVIITSNDLGFFIGAE